MDSGIGNTLREARNRRKVDLAEVEEATKIRARYLRAIENEEWGVLPGGVYTRSFIRTYASYLGLDGERLAAEHRDEPDPERAERSPRIEPAPLGVGGAKRSGRVPRGVVTAAVCLLLVVALVAIGLSGGHGGPATPSRHASKPNTGVERHAAATSPRDREGVAVSLSTSAEVWVCLLAADGRPLLDGQVLAAGVEKGPFRSGSFTVSFGNGEVSMSIDGKQAEIPATASPIGYAIDGDGALRPLSEAERPTCT